MSEPKWEIEISFPVAMTEFSKFQFQKIGPDPGVSNLVGHWE